MKNEPGKACYLPQIIEEYKGNPLIEALPSIYSSYEAAKLLTVDPGYNEGEREFDAQYRFHCIGRLFRYFQPLDTVTGKLKGARYGKQKSPTENPSCIMRKIIHGRKKEDGGYRNVLGNTKTKACWLFTACSGQRA